MKQSLLLFSFSIFIALTGCGGGGGYSSSVTPPEAPPPPPPVTPAPTVTAVNPNSGPVAGGISVTLTGTNFTGATAVKFGANDAASFTVNNATTITAVSPAGAAGTVDITVTTEGGTSATSTAGRFTYVARPGEAAGLWQGHTDGDEAIGGLVQAQSAGGAYWLVFSSASTPAPDFITAANAAGFITGVGTETPGAGLDGTFASGNLRGFNFAGAGLARGSLNAGYTEKSQFGKGLSGTGAGTYVLSADPATLTNGTSGAGLPLPGMVVLNVSSSSTVELGGNPFGSGTAAGAGVLTPSELKFSASGDTQTNFTDTTNTQAYIFSGATDLNGVFTPTSGSSEVTACVNNGGAIDGCGAMGAPVGTISNLTIASGSLTATGGSLVATSTLTGADVTTTLTFTPRATTTAPAAPTFTDGNEPWTISASGTPLLSGSLFFDDYTATVDLGGGVTADLGITERKLTIEGTNGTLVYDSGTNTLRLTNASFTDVSGPLSCSGHASICTAATLPSTTSQLHGDVVITLDTPAAGQYQAQVFIGGQSSPISTLTFDGDLPVGTPTTVNFTTAYLAAYETAPTLAAVAGNHSGSAGIESAIQPGASFNIDAAGAVTGAEASGCSYTGAVTPAASGNAYEVALTFTAGGGCTYNGAFNGVAFFDENNKLTIAATNAARDQGFLFIAQ